MPRAGFRVVIILFCLFHMAAVAAYSVNDGWEIKPLSFAKQHIVPWTRSYILMTSQWQQWNLFSPDPLRRVSHYRVQAWNNGAWEESSLIDAGLPYNRKASLTKTLRRLEEQGENAPGLLQFLRIACEERMLAPGIPIRLERMYHVLPRPEKPLTVAQWRAYEPEFHHDILAERSCP